MYKNIFWLFLFIISSYQVTAASEVKGSQFLKTFYADVDPAKVPMNLVVSTPHAYNKNIRLSFILYNTKDDKIASETIDYKNGLIT